MEEPILNGIDTVIVRVSDIVSATSWYCEKHGLTIIHHDDILKLSVLDTGSAMSLMLWQTDEKIEVNLRTTSYPIFRTADAKRSHQLLSERGVHVKEIITDHAVTYFTFSDPDGNILEACQVHQ